MENIDIRINLGHCWNSLIKNKKELIPELGEILFNFFLNNFKVDNYELTQYLFKSHLTSLSSLLTQVRTQYLTGFWKN